MVVSPVEYLNSYRDSVWSLVQSGKLTKNRGRIQLVIAARLVTMAIDALVEAILVAGGAVLHLVLQQKVKRIVLNSAVQFAFVAGRDWNREKDGGERD